MFPVGASKEERDEQEQRSTRGVVAQDRNHCRQGPSEKHDEHTKASLPSNENRG